MTKLEDVSPDDLRAALGDVTSAKGTKRLMTAIAYKDGVPVTTLSDRYGIPRSTLYSWLARFEELPMEEAVQDENRPGRPPELPSEERESLEEDLTRSPREFGFDDRSWSPELVRMHILRTYGVEYSLGHVRRLVRDGSVELG